MNRSRVSKLVGAVVAVAAIVLVVAWWRHGTVKAPKYRTEAVQVGSIVQTVSATGTITPVVQVEIGSQVSGTVAKLNADFNSRVHKGEVLLELDHSSFRARLVQAQANVAHSQAAANEMKREYDRAVELLPEKYISQADVDAALSKWRQAEADLQQAQAQEEAASVDLANSTIRSPIDGVVIDREIDLGQTVAASLQAPKLFVIANDLSQMQVETAIDEADIGSIRPGLPVTFTVDAFPDEEFQGTVSQVRLQPVTQQNVVTYTTVIRTANPTLRLRPGMTANVSVQVAKRDDVLKVPNAALRFRPPQMGNGRRGAGGGVANAAVAANADPAGAPNGSAAGGAAGAGGWRGRRGGAGGDSLAAGARAGAGNGARRWGGRAGGAGGTSAAAVALPDSGPVVMGSMTEARTKHGTVYLLQDGKPKRLDLRTGISDGADTEVISDQLKAGDLVVVGTEMPVARNGSTSMSPPPGLGGRGGRGR